MTPLGASLAFIIISIIISTIKHFIFPSNSPSTSAQSSIELKKLYTITNKKIQRQSKSYGSFYQAYHQFHISEVEQQKNRIEQNFMMQYNSLVMKKSIINGERVLTCEENFLVSIEEGITCSYGQNSSVTQNICDWQTTFNVYQLPLLKQQTKQAIQIKGQIKDTSDTKGTKLQCKKSGQNQYFIGFALSTKNFITNEQIWSFNKVQIQVNDNIEEQIQKVKAKRTKKLQVKKYDVNKIQGEFYRSEKSLFSLSHETFDLQKPHHNPKVYSSSNQGLSYSTENQPWLIRYKTDSSEQWHEMNLLQKQQQQKVYQGFSYQARSPPFQRTESILVKYIFLFQNSQILSQKNCVKKQCSQNVTQRNNSYITVVYEHINNPYRVEKFYVQMTFKVGQNQMKEEKTQAHKKPLLISHSLLISQLDPSRVIHSDCSLSHKEKKIYERSYDQYYWLYENKIVANLDIYSLLCVFRFDIDENLRVIEIDDIIRSSEKNHFYDLIFMDWKNLKKIINYKENFQIYLQNKNDTISNVKKSSQISKQQNQDSLDPNVSPLSIDDDFQEKNELDLYLQILKEQLQTNEDYQKQTKKATVSKKKEKKNPTKKAKKSLKKSKQRKKSQNISKKISKKYMCPIQGPFKPSIQNSYDYSFYRKTDSGPLRSQVRKFKFPLPFLLSFTQRMEIVNSQLSKPLILFSGVKQYLFTYQKKAELLSANKNSSFTRVVDYRYLTLGSTYQHISKIFSQSQGTPQHEIQTATTVINQIEEKTNTPSNQKLKIEIKDQTHPQVENVIKTIMDSDQKILNQIKTIKSVPVMFKKSKSGDQVSAQPHDTFQKYLIVVWGWGIEVYVVDWDKEGFLRQNVSQQQIQLILSEKSSNLIEYFLPFIELFATFYCMFQALISSR